MQETIKYTHTDILNTIFDNHFMVIETIEWNPNSFIKIRKWVINCEENILPNQFAKIISPSSSIDPTIQLVYLQHQFTTHSTAIVCSINFSAEFLKQWDSLDVFPEEVIRQNNEGLQIIFCPKSRLQVEELLSFEQEICFVEQLKQLEICYSLLGKSMKFILTDNDFDSVPACSFLANESEKNKIVKVREIIDLEFDKPLPIRELSRRVLINECYLKKGFKTMFGSSINEYQQVLRISKAKELLQNDGVPVSKVADILGYSSISHFSTAFKKATNMKPCELLK